MVDDPECILIPEEGLSEGTMERSVDFPRNFQLYFWEHNRQNKSYFLEHDIIATVSPY